PADRRAAIPTRREQTPPGRGRAGIVQAKLGTTRLRAPRVTAGSSPRPPCSRPTETRRVPRAERRTPVSLVGCKGRAEFVLRRYVPVLRLQSAARRCRAAARSPLRAARRFRAACDHPPAQG